MPEFTEAYIRSLKVEPGKREIVRYDGGPHAVRGFYVRKQLSGMASYGVKFTLDGKTQRHILGKAVPGNLKAMRLRADEVRAHARIGKDPLAERKAKKAAISRSTLGVLIPAYLNARRDGTGYKRPLRSRSFEEINRHLTKHLAPLHDRDPKTVTRPDLVQLLDAIARQNGPIAAARVKASLTTLFKWLLERGHVETFPAMSLPSSGESSETRPLTKAELRDVWQACQDDDYGRLVRLSILTALRRQNLGDMLWSEVDLEARRLEISGDRMKNRRDFVLPLSEPAVALLRGLERRGEFVFGEHLGSGFSGWSKAKAALDRRIAEARELRGDPSMPPWKIHGLRATFATLMNEHDLAPPHIVDELLAHVGPHKTSVAGRYNQARYVQQRRQAMEAWGRLVEQIVAPAGRVDHSPHTFEAIPAE